MPVFASSPTTPSDIEAALRSSGLSAKSISTNTLAKFLTDHQAHDLQSIRVALAPLVRALLIRESKSFHIRAKNPFRKQTPRDNDKPKGPEQNGERQAFNAIGDTILALLSIDADWTNALLATWPNPLEIEGTLSVPFCKTLTHLPENLSIVPATMTESNGFLTNHLHLGGSLGLLFCKAIRQLPRGLRVWGDLGCHGCTALTALPRDIEIGGSIYLSECASFQVLPDGLTVWGTLYMDGCKAFRSLPRNLKVDGDLVMTGCSAWDGRIPSCARIAGSVTK